MNKFDFLQNEMTQDAAIRNLEIIGEACRNIEKADPNFQRQNPSLPLAAAYEMRNMLAHGYFKVDLSIVWNCIETDLPRLNEEVLSIQKRSRLNELPDA